MSNEKQIYPYVGNEETRRLRRKKKEELVALVCFLSKRINILDECVTDIIRSGTNSENGEDFVLGIKKYLNDMLMSTSTVVKKYADSVEEIKPGADTLIFIADKEDEHECSECGECQSDICVGNFDSTDVNVN